MYVSESEMYIGTLYSYHSTIPIESLMPKDAFSSTNKTLPWAHSKWKRKDGIVLAQEAKPTKEKQDDLSPERQIKWQAAPFVEQYNGKYIHILHILYPSVQTSGHYVE